jgi:hypothetical protein
LIRLPQENAYRNMFLGVVILGFAVWWGFKPPTKDAAGEDGGCDCKGAKPCDCADKKAESFRSEMNESLDGMAGESVGRINPVSVSGSEDIYGAEEANASVYRTLKSDIYHMSGHDLTPNYMKGVPSIGVNNSNHFSAHASGSSTIQHDTKVTPGGFF